MTAIWPQSDTDASVEVIIIPDYHRNDPRGYVAVQAQAYSARWEHHRPGIVAVRSADGSSPHDWIEWDLDGEALDAEGSSLLGEATSGWSLDPAVRGSSALGGEVVAIMWCRSHALGELRAMLSFTAQAVGCRLVFACAAGQRVARCTLGRSAGSGTRVWADHAFDCTPDTSGTFLRPLHALRPTGALWLSPPPFAVAFHQPDDRWSVAAIECPADQLAFAGFAAEGSDDGRLAFRLDYPSQPATTAAGFTTPELVWRFGFTDAFAALQGHVDGLVAKGFAQRPVRASPDWHRRPMACGWHRQVELATQLKTPGSTPEHLAQAGFATGVARSQDFARQDVYDDHLATLESAGIDVGTIVIDHGWSVAEGDWRPDPAKWPDLKGFVRQQHARGRRVLLWVCVMNTGLPESELVRNVEGPWPWCLDPRHPRWQARMAARLRELLGPEDIGADGLKLDFTGPLRNPARWEGHPDILHGYTYLWEFYRAVSSAAWAVRPDALLDFQCAHPQFASFHTMTRLNDFFLPQAQALRVMGTRARLATIASFGADIDTDAPAGKAYLRGASAFGNQSLYLTHAQLADPALVAAVRSGQDPQCPVPRR
jgi:hypothetical protein